MAARVHVRTLLRIAAWGCVVAITILSLLPRDVQVRTGASPYSEHFVAYAGTAFLFALAHPKLRLAIAAALALSAYAGLMEALQALAPGREPGFADFAAGAAGALAGGALGAIAARELSRRLFDRGGGR